MGNKHKHYDIAIVGATGVVGNVLIQLLEERNFPVRHLYLLASEQSLGLTLKFKNTKIEIVDLAKFDFSKVQFALFSAGAHISEAYVPIAVDAGCVVIDNTSQFRYQHDVPLVVPEVNPEALMEWKNTRIIANPNCSTIQMVVALKPIYDAVGIERVNVATYQSVSGSGRKAIMELLKQSEVILQGNHDHIKSEVYPHQIAFNILPHIDAFQENGYTREEMKMIWETQKIFADNHILVNPTTVRVPVFFGHSEAVHIETHDKISAKDARDLLEKANGVVVMDDGFHNTYPTAAGDAEGQDAVFVGRIREDISHPRGLNMWIVADNIRKGAALNSIQIAELLINDYF
ncbi:MAG: aspartate-semialdehyde dehydrogenase [Gammaproteobacteria bacterium]|nr:aspartate-semialdehyde dehydrogenase [Gammaproteobacteria bacterium]